MTSELSVYEALGEENYSVVESGNTVTVSFNSTCGVGVYRIALRSVGRPDTANDYTYVYVIIR